MAIKVGKSWRRGGILVKRNLLPLIPKGFLLKSDGGYLLLNNGYKIKLN